jgi:hypothetical protein
MYVGLENGNAVAAIDTVSNKPGQEVQGSSGNPQRYLVSAPLLDDKPGTPIQVQR